MHFNYSSRVWYQWYSLANHLVPMNVIHENQYDAIQCEGNRILVCFKGSRIGNFFDIEIFFRKHFADIDVRIVLHS